MSSNSRRVRSTEEPATYAWYWSARIESSPATIASDAGAEAARAGLENLARTLSVEWARYGIRTAALLPGASTKPEEVAELVAFLASRAGDYYSGCRFDLGSV